MPTLPDGYHSLIAIFAPVFSQRVWRHVQVLVMGAILAPGKRTVTAVLSVMGLSQEAHFQTYHRVLNRAGWCSLAASRILLTMLVNTFVGLGTVVLGLDDTLERRRGAKIKAKGIYRDAVRSSHSHFVKASGLRWLSLMVLVPIPWAGRVWALPFLTALAPSERYYQTRGRGHKKLTDWGRQLLLQVRRWLPKRRLVVVADSTFAVLGLLGRMTRLANPINMVVRFRLDAALYEPAPPRQPGQRGRKRVKGARLPTLQQVLADGHTVWTSVQINNWYGERGRQIDISSSTAVWYHAGQSPVPIRWVLIRDPLGKFRSQALLCTDLTVPPEQIVQWFIMRWQIEVTFREVRTHLGVETQRQWSDLAIARTTPALFGLFSLITLLAHHSTQNGALPIRQAAWYAKPWPTFSDTIAVVRSKLWRQIIFQRSLAVTDVHKVPSDMLQYLTDALCYAT